MEKFIIVFYSEPTKDGNVQVLYTLPLAIESAEDAKDFVRKNFTDQRAQIVPILTNNGDEVYV